MSLGLTTPTEALLWAVCSPVGPYYAHGFKPVALYGTTEYIRAYPGGKSSLAAFPPFLDFDSLSMNPRLR